MSSLPPQVIGALIGAIVTATIGVLVMIFTNMGHNQRQKLQHQHELTIANRDFLKGKIEDIYLSFSKWETNFAGVYVGLIGYVKGEVSEKDAYELIQKQAGAPGLHEKVQMLLSLYFPHLLDAYEDVRSERGEVVAFFPSSKQPAGRVKEYYASQENFESTTQKFRMRLTEEINKL